MHISVKTQIELHRMLPESPHMETAYVHQVIRVLGYLCGFFALKQSILGRAASVFKCLTAHYTLGKSMQVSCYLDLGGFGEMF